MGLIRDGVEYADPDNKGTGYSLIEGDTDADLVLPYWQTQKMHKSARSGARWSKEVKNHQSGDSASSYPLSTQEHYGAMSKTRSQTARLESRQ